jgi:predicted nucleic acid-binding Zn ribbon protein
MPQYTYRCEEGHEFTQLVQSFVDSETRMCFQPSDNPTCKILEAGGGEHFVCGRTAYRQDDKSVPAKRNPAYGIQ